MKPLKSKVSITLDSPLIDTLKRLAEEDDRSLSQYINLALTEHVHRRKSPSYAEIIEEQLRLKNDKQIAEKQ